MSKIKKISFSVILTLALLSSISLTVLASETSAGTSFTYDSYTIYCELHVNWKIGNDTGYAKTYVSGSSGSYYLGAYCNAYDSTKLLGGANNVNKNSATTPTISYAAKEFRSVHNIQNSNNVPLKSAPLNIKD